MERISRRDLDRLAGQLDRLLGGDGSPVWSRQDGRNVARAGAVYVDGAYGGWAVYRVASDGHGASDLSRMGHQPARRVFDWLSGAVTALEEVGR